MWNYSIRIEQNTSWDITSKSTNDLKNQRVNVAIDGFWKKGQAAIFNVQITDTDLTQNINREPRKILQDNENEKKKYTVKPVMNIAEHSYH